MSHVEMLEHARSAPPPHTSLAHTSRTAPSQAQECVYHKALLDKKTPSTVARLAKQVGASQEGGDVHSELLGRALPGLVVILNHGQAGGGIMGMCTASCHEA